MLPVNVSNNLCVRVENEQKGAHCLYVKCENEEIMTEINIIMRLLAELIFEYFLKIICPIVLMGVCLGYMIGSGIESMPWDTAQGLILVAGFMTILGMGCLIDEAVKTDEYLGVIMSSCVLFGVVIGFIIRRIITIPYEYILYSSAAGAVAVGIIIMIYWVRGRRELARKRIETS